MVSPSASRNVMRTFCHVRSWPKSNGTSMYASAMAVATFAVLETAEDAALELLAVFDTAEAEEEMSGLWTTGLTIVVSAKATTRTSATVARLRRAAARSATVMREDELLLVVWAITGVTGA